MMMGGNKEVGEGVGLTLLPRWLKLKARGAAYEKVSELELKRRPRSYVEADEKWKIYLAVSEVKKEE